MLNDKRYSSNDTLAVINLLTKLKGEKKIYNFDVLDGAKNFYGSYPKGSWNPENIFKEREVLIIGAGSTVLKHKEALEEFINKRNLIVLALNTIKSIKNELINYRIACHPIRLMADIKTYDNFDQPIIMPASMIDKNILNNLSKDKILDFGINIRPNTFEVHNQYCIIPFPLVLAYALGVSFSGSAKTIFLAGIDGYQAGDPRNDEINNLFNNAKEFNKNIISLTPTIHKNLIIKSIYGFTIKK